MPVLRACRTSASAAARISPGSHSSVSNGPRRSKAPKVLVMYRRLTSATHSASIGRPPGDSASAARARPSPGRRPSVGQPRRKASRKRASASRATRSRRSSRTPQPRRPRLAPSSGSATGMRRASSWSRRSMSPTGGRRVPPEAVSSVRRASAMRSTSGYSSGGARWRLSARHRVMNLRVQPAVPSGERSSAGSAASHSPVVAPVSSSRPIHSPSSSCSHSEGSSPSRAPRAAGSRLASCLRAVRWAFHQPTGALAVPGSVSISRRYAVSSASAFLPAAAFASLRRSPAAGLDGGRPCAASRRKRPRRCRNAVAAGTRAGSPLA